MEQRTHRPARRRRPRNHPRNRPGSRQALEDAVALAATLDDGAETENALARYESVRRPRAELTQKLSLTPGRPRRPARRPSTPASSRRADRAPLERRRPSRRSHPRAAIVGREGRRDPAQAGGRRPQGAIAAVLRDYLIEHRLSNSTGLVFGRDTERPWSTGWITERANRAWKAAKLKPITLHECRHTFASLMIAAGVDPKALQTFRGHASITVTLDRYGHLFPGSESEAAVLLDAYLAESYERARSASIDDPSCREVVWKLDPSRSDLERP
jgi:Phage integrase family